MKKIYTTLSEHFQKPSMAKRKRQTMAANIIVSRRFDLTGNITHNLPQSRRAR